MNPPQLPEASRAAPAGAWRQALIAAVQDGLPLVPEPFAALAATAVLAVGRMRRRRPTGAPTDPAHRPEENLP